MNPLLLVLVLLFSEPEVVMESPLKPTIGEMVLLKVRANDPDGIAEIVFYLNDKEMGREKDRVIAGFWFEVPGEAPLMRIDVDVTDKQGNSTRESRLILVNRPTTFNEEPVGAPKLILEHESVLTLGRETWMEIEASDPDGIAEMDFFIDGRKIAHVEDTSRRRVNFIPQEEVETELSVQVTDKTGKQSRVRHLVPVLTACTITFDKEETVSWLDQAEHNIIGRVTPNEALLWVNQLAVEVEENGTFELTLNLKPGANRFEFKAELEHYLPAKETRILHHDKSEPTLEMRYEYRDRYRSLKRAKYEKGTTVYHGEPILKVHLSPKDREDPNPLLYRKGRLITGKVDEVALQPGLNRIEYRVEDHFGRKSEHTLLVQSRTEPPKLKFDLPEAALAGSNLEITLTGNQPEDLVVFRASMNREKAETRDPRQQKLKLHVRDEKHDFDVFGIDLYYEDRYGYVYEERVQVPIERPKYCRGQVLDDATGLPLGGIPLVVTTETQSYPRVSKPDGGFLLRLGSEPMTITAEHADYLRMERAIHRGVDYWRVHDMRLTRRLPVKRNKELAVVGEATLIPFSPQSLVYPLPLGWAPLSGFRLITQEPTVSVYWHSIDETRNLALLAFQEGCWHVTELLGKVGMGRRELKLGDGIWLLAETSRGASVTAGQKLEPYREQSVAVQPKLEETYSLTPGKTIRLNFRNRSWGERYLLHANEQWRTADATSAMAYTCDFYAVRPSTEMVLTPRLQGEEGSLRLESAGYDERDAELTLRLESGPLVVSFKVPHPPSPQITLRPLPAPTSPLPKGYTAHTAFRMEFDAQPKEDLEVKLYAEKRESLFFLQKGENGWESLGHAFYRNTYYDTGILKERLLRVGEYVLATKE